MAMTAIAPTTVAPVANPLARLMMALQAHMMDRKARQSAKRLEQQLAGMSEHSLRDIGLRRDQIPDVLKAHLTRASVSLPL